MKRPVMFYVMAFDQLEAMLTEVMEIGHYGKRQRGTISLGEHTRKLREAVLAELDDMNEELKSLKLLNTPPTRG